MFVTNIDEITLVILFDIAQNYFEMAARTLLFIAIFPSVINSG